MRSPCPISISSFGTNVFKAWDECFLRLGQKSQALGLLSHPLKLESHPLRLQFQWVGPGCIEACKRIISVQR